MPDDYERENRARIMRLEDCVSDVRTQQAVMVGRLDAADRRADERHAVLLGEVGEVKVATSKLSEDLLGELHKQAEHQRSVEAGRAAAWAAAVRDPRVLGLLGLLVLALAAPQMLGPYVAAVFTAPAIESISSPEVVEVPVAPRPADVGPVLEP